MKAGAIIGIAVAALLILGGILVITFTGTTNDCGDDIECFLAAADTCGKATFQDTYVDEFIGGEPGIGRPPKYEYQYEWVLEEETCYVKGTMLNTHTQRIPIEELKKDPLLTSILNDTQFQEMSNIRYEQGKALEGSVLICNFEFLQEGTPSINKSAPIFSYAPSLNILLGGEVCTGNYTTIFEEYSEKELEAMGGIEAFFNGLEAETEKQLAKYKKETVAECLELEKEINICIAHIAKTKGDPSICETHAYYFSEAYAPYPYTGNIDSCYVEAAMNNPTFTDCEEFTDPPKKAMCELELFIKEGELPFNLDK